MQRKPGLLIMIMTVAILSGCNAATPASASKTSTKQVTKGDLLLGLSADGKIKLPVTNLNFEVEGIIKNIYVSAGDMVKKGDILAELDDSDLQLALSNAKINLDKANAAYDDAIISSDYNLKVELANLEATKKKLDTPFDDYTYQLAISNAKTSLQRKEKDLADAKKALLEAEDVTIALSNEYTYKTAISNAKTTLERKQADLADAKKELSDAEKTVIDSFDEYQYKNAINSAEIALAGKIKELNAADPTDTAKYTAAENAVESARVALETARTNLSRAEDAYDTDEKDKKQTKIDDAKKKVETAQLAVDDAQTSLNNANTNLENARTTSIDDAAKKLDTAQMAYDDAVTALKNAEDGLERAIKSYNDDLVTTKTSLQNQALKIDNMQNSKSTISNALYSIEDAKNKLQTAENDLAKIKIIAPIDGKILNVSKNVGEVVVASTSAPIMNFGTSSGNGAITICDTSQIYMTANITEGDITGVSMGQEIRVAIDALGEESLAATVYAISSIPNTDASGIITYEVTGKLNSLNDDIKDNMSAFLNFVKKEKKDVLLIPNKAIFVEDGQQYVNVQLDGKATEKRAVTCGLSNGTQTEVVEGLNEGETVIVGSVKSS